MADVLRWGRSAYESDEALALERAAGEELGLSWELREDRSSPGSLAGVKALVTNSGVRVTDAVLERFEGSLVLTTTSGWDHIDVDAATRRGVAVLRCPMARRDPVVEQSLAWLVALMRRSPALDAASVRGEWARGRLVELGGRGLAGAKVLVVGGGVIGTRMAEVLDLLGAEVLGLEQDGVPVPPKARRVGLDALSEVDAVTLHCGLTPSSTGLFSAERLALLAPHAVVVNTARGAVLDVEAAVGMVRDGQLRGLAVDVFPEEPYTRLAEGAAVEGVLFAPHAAGYRHDLSARVAAEVGAALKAWHAGEPLPHAVATARPNALPVVQGLGGSFLYTTDVLALAAWYTAQFGFTFEKWGDSMGFEFPSADVLPAGRMASTTFALMKADAVAEVRTGRINFRVSDLDAVVASLRASGSEVDASTDESYGRFAWVHDPDGNKLELWQPPEG
ncbi:MAG: hypothetical protein KC912_06215 [Proteobacteria bacterium]|nr:hypothetical protein [Pseudomonadota bacterium]